MTIEGNLFVPLGGYGRNINHDPRSKAYRAARHLTVVGGPGVVPRDVGWEIHIPPMDQGDLGRCVPTAGTAMLATDPFWATLDSNLQNLLRVPDLAERYATIAYRDVTALDPYPGQWEPEDTGSDGLSLAKLFQQRSLVNGYQHVMGLEDAHAAIQRGPYPIGISWLSGMDTPGTDGVCQVTGRARGGHEVLVYRYDLARDLWWIRNSWGLGWGLKGDFAIDTPGYQKLMALQADGTPMTPITQPAPVPVPDEDAFPYADLDVWAHRVERFPHFKPAYERIAATKYAAWRVSQG